MGKFFSNIWNTVLFYPFLNLIMATYHLVGSNFGITVIIIAIITRLILIPSTKSQIDMTKKMTQLKPRLDDLNKKYAHNKEELAKQQMKLYREVGYNPLGCISSIVPQILILLVIVQVIRIVTNNTFDGLYPFVKDFIGFTDGFKINTDFWLWDLSKTYTQIAKSEGYFALTGIAYFALAIAVGIFQYWSTRFIQYFQNPDYNKKKPVKKGSEDEQMSPEEMSLQMTSSMNSIFPVMTFIFTLSTPAVLGIYWLAQSIMLVAQYFFIDKSKSIAALKHSFGLK